MFQKDYWLMDDAELNKLAERYDLASMASGYDDVKAMRDDRQRLISQLTAKDSSRQANATLLISIISLLGTLAAIVISILALKSD